MKIRIHEQLLRLRLAQEEVSELIQNGTISSRIQIGTSEIGFSLHLIRGDQPLGKSTTLTPKTGRPVAKLTEGHTKLEIPRSWTHGWDSNDLVGFEFDFQPVTGRVLTVIVEKDYPCAHSKEGKAIFGRPKNMNAEIQKIGTI